MLVSKNSVIYLVILFLCFGCAYRLGSPERKIPGGYQLIAVPIFKNKTKEVSAESYFTKSLIQIIESSSLAKVTDKGESQAIVLGEIESIRYDAGAQVSNTTQGINLPESVVLTKEYRVMIKSRIKLVRSSDQAVLWEGEFSGEQRYPAPLITKQKVNTANAIYNQSAHVLGIEQIAKDMMSEAFDRMTENF